MVKFQFSSIKKFFSRLFDRDKSKSELAPVRHWKILFSGLVLALIGIGLFSYYLYFRFSGQEIGGEGTGSAKTIDREELERVVEEFAGREERFKDLLKNPPPIADPS